MLSEQFSALKSEALAQLAAVQDALGLEAFENAFLGRKNGQLTNLLKSLKELQGDARKAAGVLANDVKTIIETAFEQKKSELQQSEWGALLQKEALDITQPALPERVRGHRHPSSSIQEDLEDFFTSMGFMVLDGPELESEYYNFTAVNIPADHPARDMQDTFYIKGHDPSSAKATAGAWVMRTHTSSVQVRAMQKYGAPLRAIVPGKCYRNESTDVRHEHTFYQLEGLVLDKNITFAHLKGVLEATAKHLYGPETKVRLRPKFYPFVEPGVNGEVTCYLCKGNGCRLCKQTGWLEVLGAGMVHPNVLKAGNIDPNVYQGFAFGFGLTRLAMLKYGIDDVRLLESGDIRFLEQF
jgi:phenylalanyl-tRNA synthetase alpha chain